MDTINTENAAIEILSKKFEKNYIAHFLRKYGYQSQSYNILLSDKSYFLSSKGIEGIIPYVVHAGVALGAGDPICDIANFRAFADEFRGYCRKHRWRCCFQAITERFEPVAREMGFGTIQIGEDAIVDLRLHTWTGGKFEYIRRDVRKAQKLGLRVVEYRPQEERKLDWEQQMEVLADDWFKFKGSGAPSFLIGQLSLEQPGDRKYFLVLKDDLVEAFVVCLPIYSRKGIYFDIMRRKRKPVSGTSTLLIYETFETLKTQGYEMLTLGATHLSRKHCRNPRHRILEEVGLDIGVGIYRRHRPLVDFKDKFGPTSWEPRYLAFSPSRFNPVILYALLKAYDPTAVSHRANRNINGVMHWVGCFYNKWDILPNLTSKSKNITRYLLSHI